MMMTHSLYIFEYMIDYHFNCIIFTCIRHDLVLAKVLWCVDAQATFGSL